VVFQKNTYRSSHRFCPIAGFKSAGVIVEIMNEDGTMARLPQLAKVAKKFDLKLVSIEASLQNATRQFDYRRHI
jgi:3,4-dihydroxy-2-butanone 4-phosphate synthase